MAARNDYLPKRTFLNRGMSVILAATLTTSMVPAVALAAPSGDSAQQQASAAIAQAAASLDATKLADGEYTVSITMMNANRQIVSMANSTVGGMNADGTTHTITLRVKNGEYWVVLDFQPLKTQLGDTNFVGYLANLEYFNDGFTVSGGIKGDTTPAKVITEWRNADDTPIRDRYNDPASDDYVSSLDKDFAYPKQVEVKIASEAKQDGWMPLHVFVPVMEKIQKGSGDQNCYMKIDWSTLKQQGGSEAPADDPFAGKLQEGAVYVFKQGFTTEDGSEPSLDIFGGRFGTLYGTIRVVNGENGKYEVRIRNNFNPSFPNRYPQVKSIEGKTPAGADQPFEKVVSRKAVSSTYTEWRTYVDDLSQALTLTVNYSYNRADASQVLRFAPLLPDAEEASLIGTMGGKAGEYYRVGEEASDISDYAPLYALIQKARGMEQGEATSESYQALQSAITTAQKALDTDESAQSTLDAAVAALNTAIETFNDSVTPAVPNPFNFEAGTWYEKDISAAGDIKVTSDLFYEFGVDFLYQADGTYLADATLLMPKCLIESVKSSSADDPSTAAAGFQSDRYDWRFPVQSLEAPTYLWVTYTDEEGARHVDEKFTMTTSGLKADSFEKLDPQLDRGLLWAARNAAQQVAFDPKKSEAAWDALWEAIDSTRDVQENYQTRTQEEIDGATKTVNDAVAAYAAAPQGQAAPTYGLEAGTRYLNYAEKFTNADGERLLAGADDNPLFYGANLVSFRPNADGTYDLVVKSADRNGKNAEGTKPVNEATAVKWSFTNDAATAQDAEKVGGSVGGNTTGVGSWLIPGVKDLSRPLYLWVDYTDKSGAAHQALPCVYSLDLNDGADHGFKAESNQIDTTALYRALKKAEAVAEDSSKPEIAWTTFELQRETGYAFYHKALSKTQAEVDAQVEAILSAITAYEQAEEKPAPNPGELDFDNLPDGSYTVHVDMKNASNPDQLSMSDKAINHTVDLTVKDGEYYLTFDFQGITVLLAGQESFGYLGTLQYYDEGYSFSPTGALQGTLVDATVLSTQKNADGSDVIDEFNKEGGSFAGKLYPDKATIKYVKQARDDKDGYVPLRVFVPIMDQISAESGTQNVLAQVDKTSVKVKEEEAVDASALTAAISQATEALQNSSKSDEAEAALQKALDAAKAVLADADATQAEVDAAATALNAALKTFNDSADVAEANKAGLNAALVITKAIKQGNKADDAFAALQDAIAAAQKTADSKKATQAEVDAAAAALNAAVITFLSGPDKADTSDFGSLADGVYTVEVDMMKAADPTRPSMADDAINHKAKLTVEDGKYYLDLDFTYLTIPFAGQTMSGYLGTLKYYDTGYKRTPYGSYTGTLKGATILSYQKDKNGNDLVDSYNEPGGSFAGQKYPDVVRIPLTKQAIDDEMGVPLQVYVPVMAAISADTGTQDVLAVIDKANVQEGWDGAETPAPEANFTDVVKGAWYEDGVSFVVGKGLMYGYEGTGTFGVGTSLTRAELATILWRYAEPEAEKGYVAAGTANTTGLADVRSGTWYTGAANWAVEHGVINGWENADGTRSFDPEGAVTTEQLVTILANLTATVGDLHRANPVALNRFQDGDEVSSWAVQSAAWATMNSLISGYEAIDGRYFGPQQSVTRERVATILMNGYDKGILA